MALSLDLVLRSHPSVLPREPLLHTLMYPSSHRNTWRGPGCKRAAPPGSGRAPCTSCAPRIDHQGPPSPSICVQCSSWNAHTFTEPDEPKPDRNLRALTPSLQITKSTRDLQPLAVSLLGMSDASLLQASSPAQRFYILVSTFNRRKRAALLVRRAQGWRGPRQPTTEATSLASR